MRIPIAYDPGCKHGDPLCARCCRAYCRACRTDLREETGE